MRDERGFTLVEFMVAGVLFAIIITTLYSLVFSGIGGSDTSRDVVRISEEARLGFARMVRDAREADGIQSATATSFTVRIDFNADGDTGDTDEVETFAFQTSTGQVTLNGELLMEGVAQVGVTDPFSYSANQLDFDSNADGEATWQEVDNSPDLAGGNENGVLDGGEFPYLTNIGFALRIAEGDRATSFYGEAQLRNTRV